MNCPSASTCTIRVSQMKNTARRAASAVLGRGSADTYRVRWTASMATTSRAGRARITIAETGRTVKSAKHLCSANTELTSPVCLCSTFPGLYAWHTHCCERYMVLQSNAVLLPLL
jgi:hypothetical protein